MILIPFEDIYSIFSGRNFDGNEGSRRNAIGWTFASFVPFAKIAKFGKLGKFSDIYNSIKYSIQGNGKSIATGSAELTKKGVLELDFKVPKDLRGNGIGTLMFDDAIKHYGDDVKGVSGLWTYDASGVASDNLKIFNSSVDWLGGSLTAQQAAFSTITGQWAKKHGFTNVKVLSSEIDEVEVLFTK